jgi:hypothetical protein
MAKKALWHCEKLTALGFASGPGFRWDDARFDFLAKTTAGQECEQVRPSLQPKLNTGE